MTEQAPAAAVEAYATSRFVSLRGVRTHVQVWEPDGAPTATVVALHHFYGSAQTFHRLAPLLTAAGIRVAAFDRVGFGLTERPDPSGRWIGPDAPYTRAFAVEQVRELVDHLEVDRAVVTGTSMGGAITLEFALAHPDRVHHAVPVCAPLTGDASLPPWLRRAGRGSVATRIGASLVRRGAGRIDAARVGRSWQDASRVEAADVDAHARFRDAPGWDVALWRKLVSDQRPSLAGELPRLRELDVSITPVGATGDRLVPARVARRIARDTGTEAVLVDAGHVVHAEAPDELARVIVGTVA